jgi:hypothetical protein
MWTMRKLLVMTSYEVSGGLLTMPLLLAVHNVQLPVKGIKMVTASRLSNIGHLSLEVMLALSDAAGVHVSRLSPS